MASFSVLIVFSIIKTSQVKERRKKEKQRKEAVFVVVHYHFGRLYFVHRAKSPFKNPIFETVLELLTNQVPIVVYCHSYKELKMTNFALCTVHAKMPCKCEFHTMYCLCDFGAKSPLFCRLHMRSFLLYFFDVNSFLILVISKSQALLCKDYKRGGNHLSKSVVFFLHLEKFSSRGKIQSSLCFPFLSSIFFFLEAKQPLRMFSQRMRG